MVIEIGGLFKERKVSAVQQSSQVARWQQDGSKLINVVSSANGGNVTLYTITAGKTFYVKAVQIYITNANWSGVTRLKDSVSGTYKLGITDANTTPAVGTFFNFFFDVPLAFDTSVYLDKTGGGAIAGIINIQGWEE